MIRTEFSLFPNIVRCDLVLNKLTYNDYNILCNLIHWDLIQRLDM